MKTRMIHTLFTLLFVLSLIIQPNTLSNAANNGFGTNTLISISSDGSTSGNDDSISPAMTPDGHYIAFVSSATNLTNDNLTYHRQRVYVRNLYTGVTTLVSTALDGTVSDGYCEAVSISADGNIVAFSSTADNLVTGDNNQVEDIFVKNLSTGVVTRVSVATDGTESDGFSNRPYISADGNVVVFTSGSDKLATNDNNGLSDIYAHNMKTGETTLVSVALNGQAADQYSYYAFEYNSSKISADGRYIVFSSPADDIVSNDTNNMTDVFVRDMVMGKTSRVNISSTGEQANWYAEVSAISPDGKLVTFNSFASNLVSGVTPPYLGNLVFLHNLSTGVTSVVSQAADGTLAYGSGNGNISGNDRYVVFLYTPDNTSNGCSAGAWCVMMKDLQSGSLTMMSVASDGTAANAYSYYPIVSSNGRFVVYSTFASNLVPNTNGYYRNIILHDNAQVTNFNIFGNVSNTWGIPVHGVDINYNGLNPGVTNSTGAYHITGILTGTYTLKPSLPGYSFSPSQITTSVPPDKSNINFTATPANNGISLLPNPDGYKFANPPGNQDNYTLPDMIRMFGSEHICLFFVSSGDCYANQTAVNWYIQAFSTFVDGMCDGMSITALRFFRGIDKVTDFQSGAQHTYDLAYSAKVGRNIGYYQVLQYSPPVAKVVSYAESHQSPIKVLSILQNAFATGYQSPYIVHIRGPYVMVNGMRVRKGHTLVPYAVEKLSSGSWIIKVYDSNHRYDAKNPNDWKRFIIINPSLNTWSYTFGQPSDIWQGGDDNTINTVSIDTYNPDQTGQCPWCVNASVDQVGYAQTTSNTGNIIYTDGKGGQLGYINDQFVSTIPGAFAVPSYTSSDESGDLTYYVPITATYSMSLIGQAVTQTQQASLWQFGPGYSFNLTQDIDNASNDTITISPNGQNVSMVSNQQGSANLALTSEAISSMSYQFEINNISFDANQEMQLKNDTNNQKLVIKNHGVTNQTYSLSIRRESAHGILNFAHPQLTLNPQDTDYLDYGSWSGAELTLGIDHGSDGSIDEVIPLKNGYDLYLPLLIH